MLRREFLTGIFCGTGDLAVNGLQNSLLYKILMGAKDQEKEKNYSVDVPPSLMLHSKHAKLENLIPLLDMIQANGYNAVTYSEWLAGIDSGNPIQKPIFITCDDLTLVKGIQMITVFRKMKDAFVQRGMRATFALITEPVFLDNDGTTRVLDEQDPEKWNEIKEWINQGMEIATHTSHHQTFNAADTTARSDFGDDDYFSEITKSVQLIEHMLYINGLTYKVKSLITPFGSGYSYSQPNPAIHAGVEQACKDSGVKLVIGIAGGRTPVNVSGLKESNGGVTYVGRIPPKEKTDGTGLDPTGTLGWLNQWQTANDNNDGRVG